MALSLQESQDKAAETNWTTYTKQLEKVLKADHAEKVITSLIDLNMPVVPASTKTEFVCSYLGGLVEHSLRVMLFMAKLTNVYSKTVPVGFGQESIIKCSLLHDVGKLGFPGEQYYLKNNNNWRKENLGENFVINEKLSHYSVQDLTLQFITDNKITLTKEEWHAISSLRPMPHSNFVGESVPNRSETWLSVVLGQAVKAAILAGKNKTVITVIE